MVRQRRPVALQEALAVPVRPAAAPVQGDITVAPPPDLPIYDFASISQTVAGHLAKRQQRQNREKVQEGERFVEENRLLVSDLEQDLAGIDDPAERDRVQKETFASWQRLGIIPPMGDPNHRIGYHRATGRVMAGLYWQNLQKRLDEVTLTTNPDGTPNLHPVEPEAVMAQEWAKIAQSPSVKDYFGGAEALAEKQRADGQFLERVTARRSQAEEENFLSVLSQEVAGDFDSILAANDVVTSETLQPITNKLTREFEEHNVLNPREIVMQALELSIRRKVALDPDEALRTIYAAQDLVVGGVRLGDDRGEAGLRLEELTRQVRVQAKTADEDELRNEETLRKTLIQRAQNDYLPVLQQAKRDGQSVMAAADRLEEQYVREDDELGRWQGRGAFVIDAMRETALAMSGERRTDPHEIDGISALIADGDTDSARAKADAALRVGALSGDDYLRVTNAINDRVDVSEHVEGSDLYRSVLSRYKAAAPQDYSGEIQERFDSAQVERERALNQDLAAWVKTHQGSPTFAQDHRQWLADREAADLVPLRAQAEQLRKAQGEAIRDITARQSRFQSAADIIDRGEAEGTLPLAAAADLRQKDIDAAAGKDRLVGQAFNDAAAQLSAALQVEFGGPATDHDQLAVQAEAERRLFDSISQAVDGVLADPAADPRTFSLRVRAEGRRVVDELGDSMFPGDRKSVQAGLEAGKGAAEVTKEVQRQRADRSLASTLAATLADSTSRSRLQVSNSIFAPAGAEGGASLRDPRVPGRFYEYVAGWWSGKDPIFGSPVRRENVVSQVRQARVEGLDDDATLAAMDLVGIDALDVLRGELVLAPDEDSQAQAQEEIARLEAGIRAGIAQPTARFQIDQLRARSEAIRIPLADHEFRPYITPFFRSREAFNAFTDDPAYPEFLRRLGITEEARMEWEEYQLDAIERSTQ